MSLNSWWYKGDEFTNFGDELGHIFLEMMGFDVRFDYIAKADILTTGSILQVANKIPLKSGVFIWGTGWHKQPIYRFPYANVLAVRGELTAKQLGVEGRVPYGDTGLLASYFVPAQKKEHKLGFVRHYIDQSTIIPEAHFIDPTDDPIKVCEEISKCEAIVSSSLHGCIVAHSYGIPYMRLPHANVIGGDTKWIDFASSLTKSVAQLQDGLMKSIERIR